MMIQITATARRVVLGPCGPPQPPSIAKADFHADGGFVFVSHPAGGRWLTS